MTDLLKAFNTVDPTISLKKLELNDIGRNDQNLIKNYPSNRKQFIEIVWTTNLKLMKCRVPEISISAPFLFTLYVSDLKMLQISFIFLCLQMLQSSFTSVEI